VLHLGHEQHSNEPSRVTTIAVKNWERFQHYKDRDPPWIKLYRDMLTSEPWLLGTDLSRLVQVAITLLAARYQNDIPNQFSMLKKVASFDCTEKQFNKAIDYLASVNFLEIRGVTSASNGLAQDASGLLASCNTETEQSREENSREDLETEQSRDRKMSNGGPSDVDIVFDHYRQAHSHPKSALGPQRRKLIADALKLYSVASLCQAITGYRNSPFHMGQNDKGAVYDSLEVMLRNPKQIDAGLKFYESPPATQHSSLTRKNIAATEGWLPPEIRNAKH
jgi:hypothetical protein